MAVSRCFHMKFEGWTISDNIKFNKDKCHNLDLGRGNLGYSDRLGNESLESSTTEKGYWSMASWTWVSSALAVICLLQVLYLFCQHHKKYLAVTKMLVEPEKLDLMNSMFSRTTSSVQAWSIRTGSQCRNYFRQLSSVTYYSVFKKSSWDTATQNEL